MEYIHAFFSMFLLIGKNPRKGILVCLEFKLNF